MAVEPLKALETEEQAQRLLQALRKDMPHSLHVMNNLECLLEWKRTGLLEKDFHPALRYAMYRYAGDGDSSDGDATMVTVTKVEPYFALVCMHTTDATGTALRRVLADSALLPWDENTLFESVHERCVPALLEEIRARGDLDPEVYRSDKMFLPKDEALQFDVRFHFESGSNDGDGYTSVIFRAIVQGEGKKDDMRLICKTTMTDLASKGCMQFVFHGEAEIYNNVFPILEDLAKLKAPLPWPKCFHAKVGPARPCMVLEDKGTEGFRMANRLVPMDERHLHHALTQLGRFHGAVMAMEVQRPDEFRDIAEKLTEPFRKDEVRNMWKSFLTAGENTHEMMRDWYPQGSEMLKKLERFFSTFIDNFLDEILTPRNEVGNCIIHGDCHVNNMLFQYDEAGAVTGCCLIDFQTARYSATALDMASLVLVCSEKATRDKHLDDLLKHYHTVLQDTLRASGVKDPDAVYSWKQFMKRLGQMAGYGLFMTPILVHAMNGDLSEVKEMQEKVADIFEANETTSEETTATLKFNIKWTPALKQRIADLAEDMVQRGWL